MPTTQQTILHGKSEKKLRDFPDDHFDSCVTDAPYGIRMMNRKWDYDVPKVELWKEIWRVMKPGAHILVACGTRTQHRMAVNIEDAGFEIKDVISWIHAEGFPKNLDISKQIDKEAGATREIIGKREHPTLKDKSNINRQGKQQFHGNNQISDEWDLTAPATDAAKRWIGYGTALKPSVEFWTLARKPLSETTIAQNVLRHGTGGLNIAGSKISFNSKTDQDSSVWGRGTNIMGGNYVGAKHGSGKTNIEPDAAGRWPANLILDEYMAAELDKQAPKTGAYAPVRTGQKGESKGIYGDYAQKGDDGASFHDGQLGGASRFFYCAKADTYERNKGCENLYWRKEKDRFFQVSKDEYDALPAEEKGRGNIHVTIKPLSIMRYLVKLITPKYGHVLDPFDGSGSTGVGAKLELMSYTGIDQALENCIISEARIAAWNPDKYIEQKLF